MKVIVKGSLTVTELAKQIIEIAGETVKKVQIENEGVLIKDCNVAEAEVTFKFDIEGQDEPQLMTVTHHEGASEVFTWLVDVDRDKQVSTTNNQDKSLYDPYSVATAQGKDFDFKEIQSEFSDVQLEQESTEEFGDMKKIMYDMEDGKKLVRVYHKGKLIQEYTLVPKKQTA